MRIILSTSVILLMITLLTSREIDFCATKDHTIIDTVTVIKKDTVTVIQKDTVIIKEPC